MFCLCYTMLSFFWKHCRNLVYHTCIQHHWNFLLANWKWNRVDASIFILLWKSLVLPTHYMFLVIATTAPGNLCIKLSSSFIILLNDIRFWWDNWRTAWMSTIYANLRRTHGLVSSWLCIMYTPLSMAAAFLSEKHSSQSDLFVFNRFFCSYVLSLGKYDPCARYYAIVWYK